MAHSAAAADELELSTSNLYLAIIWRSPLISQSRDLSAIAPRHLSEPRTADPNLAPLHLCGSLRSTWDFSG
ncbi:hypothetical protein, partial [Thermoleptolyngbya sp.]